MPFDGQNAALTLPDTLAAALIESGIDEVESHVLDAHKAEELRRHPASWFIGTESRFRSRDSF